MVPTVGSVASFSSFFTVDPEKSAAVAAAETAENRRPITTAPLLVLQLRRGREK